MPVTTTSLLTSASWKYAPPSPAREAQIQRRFFARAKSSGGTVPYAASAVSMSATASLGSAYILATAPGTACPIFSGHDGSASGDSSRIVKLIVSLQLVSYREGKGSRECQATTPQTPRPGSEKSRPATAAAAPAIGARTDNNFEERLLNGSANDNDDPRFRGRLRWKEPRDEAGLSPRSRPAARMSMPAFFCRTFGPIWRCSIAAAVRRRSQ